jgi:DNA-binding transcriptional ArsR family regulator
MHQVSRRKPAGAANSSVRTIDYPRLSYRLKQVSDPVRIRIVMFLGEVELSAVELSAELGISPAALAYHLAHLRAARVVMPERAGKRVLYNLTEDGREMLRAIRKLPLGKR